MCTIVLGKKVLRKLRLARELDIQSTQLLPKRASVREKRLLLQDHATDKLEFMKIAGEMTSLAKEPEQGASTMVHILFGIGIMKIAMATVKCSQ